MTKFRPCIDLHQGQVKQIVGGTLNTTELKTNHIATHPPSYYAELYKQNNCTGAHVIMLGPGNEKAAKEALEAWPHAFQLGGGINHDNALEWLDAGAKQVIVTSYFFTNESFDYEKCRKLSEKIGKSQLVVDLSCRRVKNDYRVFINKWQTPTDLILSTETMQDISMYCDEFLVHAADVEGLCSGIDETLVKLLGDSGCKVTYAGGAKSMQDLETVQELTDGKVDLTFGSALDLFGGQCKFQDLVAWNNKSI